MNGITGNAKAVMATGTGTVQQGNSVFTDLVMEGLDVQFSPSLQDRAEDTDNARVMAYRDRILEAAGGSKEKA